MNEESRSKIMGGLFGLEPVPSSSTCPPFLQPGALELVNARSAIRLLVETLSPASVWLPSYLAPSMLGAVGQLSTPRYYEITYDLEIAATDWVDEVSPGDLVIFIDYFGFPGGASCAGSARERGAFVLRDASQALLSDPGGYESDFVVFSPRKHVGVVDGGVLTAPGAPEKLAELRERTLESPPAPWWLSALDASILRREFDRHGGSQGWFDVYREAEREQPMGAFEMSELSRCLLRHGFDYEHIASRRRENYARLADRIGEIALFPELPASVVPLGFPVRLQSRTEIQRALFEHAIYPSIHWSLPENVPDSFAGSHRLAERILTLPCDQRYDPGDMDAMVERLCRVAVHELV